MIAEAEIAEMGCADLDWFAVDREGQLGHFATGGNAWLPESIARTWERQALIERSVLELAPRAEPQVLEWVDLEFTGIARRMLASFTDMAARGLFSFNRFPLTCNNLRYRLLARPQGRRLLLEDLPEPMRGWAGETRLAVRFDEVDYWPEEAVGER